MMETGIQRNLRFLRVFRQREQDLYISLLIMCKYQFDRIIIYQLHTGRNKPCGISGFIKILCGHTDRFSAKLKRLQIGNDFRLHTNILAIAGVQHQIAKFFRFLFYFNPFSFVLDINLILDKRIPRFLRRSLIKHNFHRIITSSSVSVAGMSFFAHSGKTGVTNGANGSYGTTVSAICSSSYGWKSRSCESRIPLHLA